MTSTQVRRAKVRRDLSGVLLLDKPAGISSNSALQRARTRLGARKAGHTGNLDVEASGLLPVCFGEATKISGWLLDSDKIYEATLSLGVTTDTGDAEGRVREIRAVTPVMLAAVPEVLSRFLGSQTQVPPMYSALKRNGRPLYELARAGIEVERLPRQITVYALEALALVGNELRLRVHCSKGTYVRVLAEDIGEALGCGASLTALRRTHAGPFGLGDAVTLEALEACGEPLEAFDHRLLPADVALVGMPVVVLPAASAKRLLMGQVIPVRTQGAVGAARAYAASGEFLGLVELDGERGIRPRRLFGIGPGSQGAKTQ